MSETLIFKIAYFAVGVFFLQIVLPAVVRLPSEKSHLMLFLASLAYSCKMFPKFLGKILCSIFSIGILAAISKNKSPNALSKQLRIEFLFFSLSSPILFFLKYFFCFFWSMYHFKNITAPKFRIPRDPPPPM